MTIFCGIDWAERHHDVAVVDQSGRVLVTTRIGDDLAGFTRLCGLLAEHTGAQFTPVDVAIGDRPRSAGRGDEGGRPSGVRHEPESGRPLPGPVYRFRAPIRPG